jgi:hypothetical protein
VAGGLEKLARAEATAHAAMSTGMAGAVAALSPESWDPSALLQLFAQSGPGEAKPGARGVGKCLCAFLSQT